MVHIYSDASLLGRVGEEGWGEKVGGKEVEVTTCAESMQGAPVLQAGLVTLLAFSH
jgi:hypothetical protein